MMGDERVVFFEGGDGDGDGYRVSKVGFFEHL